MTSQRQFSAKEDKQSRLFLIQHKKIRTAMHGNYARVIVHHQATERQDVPSFHFTFFLECYCRRSSSEIGTDSGETFLWRRAIKYNRKRRKLSGPIRNDAAAINAARMIVKDV